VASDLSLSDPVNTTSAGGRLVHADDGLPERTRPDHRAYPCRPRRSQTAWRQSDRKPSLTTAQAEINRLDQISKGYLAKGCGPQQRINLAGATFKLIDLLNPPSVPNHAADKLVEAGKLALNVLEGLAHGSVH
jgi:hypothetical protein